MGRKPTQADIARHAGVSTATVSRVLNRSPLVREEVRQLVEAAIADIGYYPDGSARALASNRTFTVGAVIPTLNNAVFASGINAFESHLQEAGYTLLVAVSSYQAANEELQVRRLLERGVEGLLLVGNSHAPHVYETLRRSHTPYVNTWAYDPAYGHPNIGFSNWKAARAAVDHLVGLGHRRIGMIAGVTANNDRAADRLDAVKRRLVEHGLELDARSSLECPYSIEEARGALGRIVEQGALADALVCGNDVIALGVLFEARSRNIDVPGRLSIVGFDDLPLTRHVSPALTTVAVPAARMGALAAEALLAAIETGQPPESVELEAPLVVRETTAPPGSSSQ
ncbi:MAG: LacI family DNA-binding transcriptional regulator [Hyphomicrobiales bacterium]